MRTSSSVGFGLRSSSAVAEISIPGVQKPHWTPPSSRNARCSGCSSPPSASPSTVVTSLPSACSARYEHELTGLPSSSTMQAPHSESSHPSLLPVSPISVRSTDSRLRPGSISTGYVSPLTFRFVVYRTLSSSLLDRAVEGGTRGNRHVLAAGAGDGGVDGAPRPHGGHGTPVAV